MKVLISVAVAGAAILGGCASSEPLLRPETSLARLAMFDDANQARNLEKALTDPEIAILLDADIKAKLPTSIAVAKVTCHYAGDSAHLDTIGTEELAGWAKAAAKQPLIKGVHPVSALSHASESVNIASLRRSAARMGCELLLVYLRADSGVDNYNDAAILYWTFAGLWLVPGNTYEHQTLMEAVLVDCRTGAILGTATGESKLSRHHAAAYKDITVDQLTQEAPKKALADVQDRFAQTLDGIVRAAEAKAKAQTAMP